MNWNIVLKHNAKLQVELRHVKHWIPNFAPQALYLTFGYSPNLDLPGYQLLNEIPAMIWQEQFLNNVRYKAAELTGLQPDDFFFVEWGTGPSVTFGTVEKPTKEIKE